MHGEWSDILEPHGGWGSIVSSGRMRTWRGDWGGLVDSSTTITAEPWREGQHGLSRTTSAESGKEDERPGMTGKRVTLMRR